MDKIDVPDWALEQAMILACMEDELLSNWQIDTLAIKLAEGEILFEDYQK